MDTTGEKLGIIDQSQDEQERLHDEEQAVRMDEVMRLLALSDSKKISPRRG